MSVSKKFRRYRGWIAAGVLVAIGAAAFLVLRQSGAEEPTTTYTTEAVATSTISVTVSGTGNLEVDGTTDVYPAISGTVASVKVAEGDSVKKGAVLFTLDVSSAEADSARSLASYRQSQQGVAQAEAQLVKAENTLDDLENRYADQESGVTASTTAPTTSATSQATTTEITQSDIDAAEMDIATAEAGLASAKASRSSSYLAYEQAKSAENDLVVTAPTSGIIWSLDIEPGDSISSSGGGAASSSTGAAASTASSTSSASGVPVVIAPKQPLAVHLTVNEVDVPTLAIGQRADIEFDAFPDLTATGKVYEIADEGTNTQGVVTYDVWLNLDVADDALRVGMSTAATIVTEIAKDTLVVPNSAVKSDSNGGSYVLVLDSGATEPRSAPIETGLANATQTQVLSGLKPGDAVVTQTTSSDSGSDSQQGGFGLPGMGGGPRG